MFVLHCRRFAPTLFPQWGNNRADTIRPYERLEISAQLIQWHRLRRGGYQPPANVTNFWAEPYWPGSVPMLPIFHVSTLYRRISPYNVRHCIVGALRRRCFPGGETTGRILSVMLLSDRPRRSFYFDSLWVAPPYMDVPHRNRCVICGSLKSINYRIDCVHCQSVWFMEHFIACCFIFFLTGQTHLVTIEL